MANDVITLRKMELSDIDEVVDVHMKSFKGFFLTVLGKSFLKVLYSFFVTDDSAISFVAVQDTTIVGFVAGTKEPQGFYLRALKSKLFSFGLASIPAVIKNPTIIIRLMRALSKPGESESIKDYCELLSIGVLPNISGKGIGRLLEQQFCVNARNNNMRFVTLTTDKNDNEHANAFYQSCGYEVMKEFETKENRQMFRYLKSIN